MPKINVEEGLLKRAEIAAQQAGYSSVEELVASAIEHELARLGQTETDQDVTDQLRGLGYLE